MDRVELKQLIEDSGILVDISEESSPALQKKGLDYGFSGICNVEQREIRLLIGFSKFFPRHKPTFFFENRNEHDYIPHIESDGAICYTRDENLVLDASNPVGVLSQTFEMAIATLTGGFSGKNHDDFLNEFESYWIQLPGAVIIYANIELTEKVETIKIGKHKIEEGKTPLYFAVSDTQERVNSIERFLKIDKNPPLANAIYIPLEKGLQVSVPQPNKGLSIEFIRELIFGNISDKNKKLLITLLTKYKRQEEFLLIGIPQPNGNKALVGIRLNGGTGGDHILMEKDNTAKIKPLHVQRLDKEFMLKRGGNGQQFTDKRILLIGGGAVGGFIADELVRSTFLNIDIIDKDELRTENCYRHVCGYTYLEKNKAEALRLRLQKHFPHSNIEAIPSMMEELIEKRKIDWKKYDAVLVATGNVTINMYLAEYFKEHKLAIPLIFSWVDPYGIGGHCLLTYIKPKGCYCCLYSDEKNPLQNKASFAGPVQPKPFLKSISGCGGLYSPYAGSDASQTAILTVRKLISYFNGKEPDNAIYSWKGETDQFLVEGFILSPRYSFTVEELEANKSNFAERKCSICGK